MNKYVSFLFLLTVFAASCLAAPKEHGIASTKMLIKKLNQALRSEYAATIQYVQHAASIRSAHYAAIARELVKHAEEENAHAVKVATMIVDLGGTATVHVDKRKTSNNETTMLEQDLDGEVIAIALYKEIITMAKDNAEHTIIPVLEGILAQEEEHRRDLLEALGRKY